MKKLIIIPAFNEESNIEKTVTAIQKTATDFDYVIINDCSTDRTREICEKNKYNIVNYQSTSELEAQFRQDINMLINTIMMLLCR